MHGVGVKVSARAERLAIHIAGLEPAAGQCGALAGHCRRSWRRNAPPRGTTLRSASSKGGEFGQRRPVSSTPARPRDGWGSGRRKCPQWRPPEVDRRVTMVGSFGGGAADGPPATGRGRGWTAARLARVATASAEVGGTPFERTPSALFLLRRHLHWGVLDRPLTRWGGEFRSEMQAPGSSGDRWAVWEGGRRLGTTPGEGPGRGCEDRGSMILRLIGAAWAIWTAPGVSGTATSATRPRRAHPQSRPPARLPRDEHRRPLRPAVRAAADSPLQGPRAARTGRIGVACDYGGALGLS